MWRRIRSFICGNGNHKGLISRSAFQALILGGIIWSLYAYANGSFDLKALAAWAASQLVALTGIHSVSKSKKVT